MKTPSYNEIMVMLLEVQLSLVEAIQNSESILVAKGTPTTTPANSKNPIQPMNLE
jgi:hypothetical protein